MRKITVFTHSYVDAAAWLRRSEIPRAAARIFNVHEYPTKIRGLSETSTAFVFLTDELPSQLLPILDVYERLGVPEFHRTDTSAIRAWLKAAAGEKRHMSVDTKKYRDRIKTQEADWPPEARQALRESDVLGITVPIGDLEKLLEVYEAAVVWNNTRVCCREDSHDRDNELATLLERVLGGDR